MVADVAGVALVKLLMASCAVECEYMLAGGAQRGRGKRM